MAEITRFKLDDLLGNEVVDFTVLDNNYRLLGDYAAHLAYDNTFQGNMVLDGPTLTLRGNSRVLVPSPYNTAPSQRWMIKASDGPGTELGVSPPTIQNALNDRRNARLVLWSLEPTGSVVPASATLRADEDAKRISLQATGQWQDLTPATLFIGAGGQDRITVPPTGPVLMTGGLNLGGDLTLASGTINGALTVTGATQLRGGLQVTAGATSLSSTLNVAGATTLGAGLTVTGNATVSGAFQAASLRGNPLYLGSASLADAGGGNINFSGYIYVPGGSGVILAGGASLTYTRLTLQGGAYVATNTGDRIQIGNHIDLAYDLIVGRNAQVNGQHLVLGRLITNNWDVGWANSLGGNVITSGYFYQRGSASYRVWDNGDFNFSVAGYGGYVVQRDGSGQIQVGGVYMPTGAQGGKPAYVCGQTGDGWMRWWPANAIGPPALWQAQLTAGSGQDSASVTLPYTGYYMAVARAKGGEYSPCWQLACYMYVGGNTYAENYGTGAKPGHPQWDDSYVTVYMPCTYYPAGTQARFHPDCAYADGNEMFITFVPSSQYPGN